jgi:nicotinamidase-related amidase
MHLDRPALLVIDVQRGFDDAAHWGERDNPDCEANVAALIAHWRDRAWPIVFVRHDSTTPGSPLAPGCLGNDFKDAVTGEPDLLVTKHVNSSFHGTPDLHAWLQAEGLSQIVISGISTNHCCETTARVSGNLGYDTYLALDATHSFDRTGPDGVRVPAATLAAITATNLHGEFATVVSTADLVG